ncbi:alpha/beta fold hydrolase [Modestobacter sp. I12A-02662]|uniref:alpha/beta fold hydrolase n=1 Tax=Modestobacter sp. I12A-02662 TaxID=1730496 RepID=UPI0034DDE7FA
MTSGIGTDRLAPVGRSAVDVDGVRTSYLQAGPPEAEEAVVLVHGNPGPAEDWRRLVSRVGAFARAVAPDMPGYGESDKPDRFVYTVDGYARHLDALLDRLAVRRAHLVLHDFGGPWGLTWAADHPDRVASVVLVNVGVLRDYPWHSLARIWRTSGLGEVSLRTTTLRGLRLAMRQGSPRGLPLEALERMHRASRDPAARRAVLRLYRATDMAAVADDLHRRLPGDRWPVLVVWGARDPYVPVRWADRQRETFPRAEVRVLADSGHWPMLDSPVALELPVLAFLRASIGAASGTAVPGPRDPVAGPVRTTPR